MKSQVVLLFFSTTFVYANRHLNIVKSYESQLDSLSEDHPYKSYLAQHVDMLRLFKRSAETAENLPVVENIRKKLFSIAKPLDKPTAVFLGGGMAAGKSSITSVWQNLFTPTDGFVLIDVDAIMMELPEYQRILNTTKARCAAVDLHHTAGGIGTQFLSEALKSRLNLVYDGTLTTVSSVDRLDKAIEAGHSVVVIGVTSDTEIALKRAADRAKRTGRYVAACDLIDTHKKFSRRFMSYAARPLRDIRLYDTSSNNTTLVVQKDMVKSWDLFDKFTWKAVQTVREVERNLTADTMDQYDKFHSLCGICKKESNGDDNYKFEKVFNNEWNLPLV